MGSLFPGLSSGPGAGPAAPTTGGGGRGLNLPSASLYQPQAQPTTGSMGLSSKIGMMNGGQQIPQYQPQPYSMQGYNPGMAKELKGLGGGMSGGGAPPPQSSTDGGK